MPAPSVLYRSALQTDALPQGQPRVKYPLPADCPIQLAAYAFDQEFSMLLSTFGNNGIKPKNTPAASFSQLLTDTNAILTSYTQPQDKGAGIGEFTATFARVPGSWDEIKSQVVTFPGWLNTPASGLARPAKSRNVSVRYHYDYFVIDPAGILKGNQAVTSVVNAASVLDSAGQPVQLVGSKGNIPPIIRAVWVNTLAGNPAPYSEVPDLVPAAGSGGSYEKTFPTQDTFLGWCETAKAFISGAQAWDQTHPPVWDGASAALTFGQYILDNSSLVTHLGNIVARVTPYVLAE